MTGRPLRWTLVTTATRLEVILLKSIYAFRIGELIGLVTSRTSTMRIGISRNSSTAPGSDDHHDDDDEHQNRGKFIGDTIELAAARVGVAHEILAPARQGHVERGHQDDAEDLHVPPAAGPVDDP